MQALRTRAVGVARRARPTTLRTSRSYASESHGHHGAHNVEEGLGVCLSVVRSRITCFPTTPDFLDSRWMDPWDLDWDLD